MTFSLVARCERTGMFGVAISSSSPAVAARCSYARAGVGAVASQNVTDPTLGPLTLDLMESGLSAADAVAEVKRRGAFIEYRQVLAVDRATGRRRSIPGRIRWASGRKPKRRTSHRAATFWQMTACRRRLSRGSSPPRAILATG